MATADADEDTTQTSPPPASPPAGGYDPATLNTIIQQLMQQPAPPQPVAQPSSTEGRGALSLLGEAIGGGEQYGTTQQREAAGLRALQSMGMNMMANSGYAPVRTPFGQILASGMQGAQQSLGESQSVEAAQMGAQQQYAEKQQEMNLQRIKMALPLLQLQTTQKALAGLQPPGTGTNVAQGGSIAAPAFTGDLEKDRQIIAQRELGGDPTALNYVALADPTAYARGATASGKYQFVNSTWQEGMKLAGLDPSKYPTAMSAPESVQDQVFTAVYGKYGTKPWDASTFKQNWVPTPTGQMILANVVPGGSKTAGGPPAPTTATTPPAATAARSGSGFGTSAFNAPTRTIMPAPASQATAPNTTATLPPVPTPQMAAARALAVKAGRPMPIAGTDGLFAHPDGSVGPGPGGGGLGRRADISPIVQGMQTAQTTMPPSSVVGAGPAAGGGTTPAVSSPAPAGAFGGGAFTTAPAQTVGAPAAPAPQGSTQASPASATPSAVSVSPPAETPTPTPANTFVYKPSAIPDEFKGLVAGTLTPAQIQNLETAKAGALQNWQLARATNNPTAIAAAQDAYNKTLADENQMLQTQTDKGRDFLRTFYKDDFQQQKDVFETNQKSMLDRAAKTEELQTQADISTGQDTLKLTGADAAESRKVMTLLTQMGPQLENLPNGVVGTLVDKYPELVPILQQSGIVDPKQATNIQLLQSARAYLSLLQKPAASGSLRTAEMSNLASYTPATLNTPQARQEMLGRLLATNQRVIDENNFTSNYFGRTDPATGKPLYNLRNLDAKMNAPLKLDANGNPTADSGLGPVVPEPPPLTSGVDAHQAYQTYVANNVRQGFPYYTYRQRTDPTTRLPQFDQNGNKVMDRVLRLKGVNDVGPGG